MLRFKNLRWKNFLSTGQYFNEIYLDKYDRTLVSGENGAGKSTILDALTYSLYGKSFRGINIKNLVNSVNEKDCVVEVEFQTGKHSYLVRRGMKPKIFEIHKDGNLLDQDAKALDYQQMLEDQILKMSYKAFCQVVILGSSNYTPFMKLSTGDRRSVVEDLLDINIFSLMNSALKSRLTTAKDKLVIIKGSISTLEAKIDGHERVIDTLEKKKQESVDKYLDQIKDLESKREDLEKIVNDLCSKYKAGNPVNEREHLKSAVDQEERKLLKSEGLQTDLKKKIKKIDKDAGFFKDNNHCPTCEQSIEENFKDKMVASYDKKKEKYEDAIKDITKIIDDFETTIPRLFERVNGMQEDVKSFLSMEKEVASIDGTIKQCELMAESTSSFGDEYKKETALLEETNKKYDEVKGENDSLIVEKSDLDLIAVLLKDDGIKAKIIKHYLPIMNNLINQHLSQMGLFCQFTLDEKFNESILARHRDAFSYNNFSEGERLRIDLSFLFTWREIARMKNSVSCNLLILDEVFDSSLDNIGTEEFMKIIHNMRGNANVFVISHKADQISDKFINHITFEKKGNFSNMTFLDRKNVD